MSNCQLQVDRRLQSHLTAIVTGEAHDASVAATLHHKLSSTRCMANAAIMHNVFKYHMFQKDNYHDRMLAKTVLERSVFQIHIRLA